MGDARITSMEPFDAFWHPRFGMVMLMKVTTEPDVRDYAMVKHACCEDQAPAAVAGLLMGFCGVDNVPAPRPLTGVN